jgi:hypothetical protein
MARGEYFKWNGADDVIAPEYLKATLAALHEHPRAAGIFVHSVYVDEAGAVLLSAEDVVPLSPWPLGKREQGLRVLDALFQDGKAAMVITMGLFKTSLVSSIRPMGNYQGADWVTALELALTGDLLYLPERPLAFFRVHPGSSSFRHLTDYVEVQRFFDPSVRSRAMIAFQRKRRFLELARTGLAAPDDRRTSVAIAARAMGLAIKRARERQLEPFGRRVAARLKGRSRPPAAGESEA